MKLPHSSEQKPVNAEKILVPLGEPLYIGEPVIRLGLGNDLLLERGFGEAAL